MYILRLFNNIQCVNILKMYGEEMGKKGDAWALRIYFSFDTSDVITSNIGWPDLQNKPFCLPSTRFGFFGLDQVQRERGGDE